MISIPSLNIMFEYQGKQHYEAAEKFGSKSQIEAQIKNDRRKRRVCEQKTYIN